MINLSITHLVIRIAIVAVLVVGGVLRKGLRSGEITVRSARDESVAVLERRVHGGI